MKYSFGIIALFVSLGMTIVVTSCNHNMEQMATDFQSGVVMVQTIEYYEMVMGNGESLYFTGSDFDKNTGEFIGLSAELDSLIPDIFYGTGFFISEDGRIATNRHVVEGNISEKDARAGIGKILGALEDDLEKSKEEYTHFRDNMISFIKNDPDTVPGFLQAKKDALEYFNQRLEFIDLMLKQLKQIDPLDIKLNYYNDVRVGYNNTFINAIDELKPCEIRVKSDTDDLAIIQLHDKRTPQGRHVFRLTHRDMIQHYSYGEFLMHLIGKDKNKTLMMIGYNAGPQGGITKEGLNAHHQRGALSRYIDSSREFEYDIPALDGSSGSPVFNRRGQVVGINYARIDASTNNINCGVKEKYLFELNKNL